VISENILLQVFVIFTAAKLAGELFHRLNQPPVIGEILVGVALGGTALGLIPEGSEVLDALQEIGAVILLFMVGLDTRPSEIRIIGGRSLAVGAMGIVLPFFGGLAFIFLIDGSFDEAVFVGAAMVATSVGITARVLSDLGVVHEIESRIILGAAVVDDILGLLVLALVGGLVAGDLSPLSIAALAGGAVGFVVIAGLFGTRVVGAAAPKVERSQIRRGPLALALSVCLGLSAVAGALGLAAIVGAFLAGMAFSELRPKWDLEEQLEPIYELVVPFFFVVTGAAVDLTVLVRPGTLGAVGGITALAVAGKLIGCGGAAWGMGTRSMSIIGVGMVPRGEVGIIVATVGLSRGVLEPDLYAVVVTMSVLTTLIAPPALKALYAGRPRDKPPHVGGRRNEGIEGIGG